MCSMCHQCGAEPPKYDDESKKQQNYSSLRLDDQECIWSCKICQERNKQESEKQGGFSLSASPMISPTTALSSSDRSESSCSDLSVDINSYNRNNPEEDRLESAKDKPNHLFNGCLRQSSSDTLLNGLVRMSGNNLEDINIGRYGDTVRDVEISQTTSNEENDNCCSENTARLNEPNEISWSGGNEIEDWLWYPPEPEDPEDDLEGSVGYNDDDDDYGDGTKWGKPGSLSCCRDEGNGSNRFKVEKEKAMQEVINGKFKAIVNQLLKAEGVASLLNDGENWVDIVTSLSWEAALFLKPDAINGKARDPDGYVKVKCIATGSCNESQLVKGLVFKKRAAHKHMPTKYKNPRLLLIQGVLGQSSSVFSSLNKMDQEKNSLKTIVEMIDMCHPNVVLVEKSVSRDVQESILAKGMTLVYDMKLHRLERVARCTGSPILTSDGLLSQKLKHCDSFYIEKFVEEHAGLGEGEKKPSKTLMFIEGCPTRLGCTILLKGSHNEELKRIKSVVQIAVNVAYHLILETSYLVHQKAMFSTILLAGSLDILQRDQESSALVTNSDISDVGEAIPQVGPSAIDIPINSDMDTVGSVNFNVGLEDNTALPYMTYNPAVFSGFSSLSASLKKVIGENFPLTSGPYQSLSNYFGFSKKVANSQITEDVTVSKTSEDSDSCTSEAKGGFEEGRSLNDGQNQSPSSCFEGPLDLGTDIYNQEVQVIEKDNTSPVFDSLSILVLMSKRNAFRGTICEQSHFSHIMFYRNFDVHLGKFLRDNLLNQRSQCSTCGELPEAHYYYYAHHDKQLTIRLKRLHKSLPGEAEGKLWMWSCCSKCKRENGAPKSTKRVLISTAACCLSFGKFLELSLSRHPSFDRLSSCGHLLERDFIYFFGLGPMVAMFRYSPVITFTVSLPPGKLEFNHSIRYNTLMEDYDTVYKKGSSIFQGIADALKNLRSQFSGSILYLQGSVTKFSDIEDMLNQEHSEFEISIRKVVSKNGNTDEAAYKHLRLNRLLWELLLASYIWEQRLHSLMLPDPSVVGTVSSVKTVPDQFKSRNDTADGRNGGNESTLRIGNEFAHGNDDSKAAIGASSDINELSKEGITIDTSLKESMVQDTPPAFSMKPDISVHHHSDDSMCLAENFDQSGYAQFERSISISTDSSSCDSVVDLDASKRTSPVSSMSSLENSHGWFWMPFSEIRQMYMKDLQRGFNPKFQSISSYIQEHISDAYQLISEEGSRLHIPLGIDDYIVRDYDGELSSIIACALAFSKDLPILTETFNEDGREGGMPAKSIEGAHILTRVPSVISPHLSSTGSSDADSVHSTVSISSEESHLSSFDGLNLLESALPSENLSPEVCLGVARSLGKSKYSVICLYAKKFRDLRNLCCPSEFDYIASLSRCRNWDAKGGKSKSFFAKTLDDRFIIKEIKKTEFESFVKFAPHYFKYMNESFELGNQTCLAKVLGIYQVIMRQTKSGKEIKHDLMVMENLTFGRNITRQYDLKGALHARYNSASDSGDVLLDQNFVNDMNSSPLYVSNQSKRILERAVWNDTTFLNSINVMDYSLLVGVDVQRRELVCGIIDYLRQYTWDKQLETWVKSSLVVPKNILPTVISPKEYKKRFRKFMATHFLSVPDSWCSKKGSDTCRLCGISDHDCKSNGI